MLFLFYNGYFLKLYFLVFCFIELCRNVSTDKGGTLYLKLLCYKNMEHLTVKGEKCDILNGKCDTFFTICISNMYINNKIRQEICPIYYKKTKIYYDVDAICTQPIDNRGELSSEMKIDLAYPIPNIFYVNIEAHDKDEVSSDDLIASFSYQFQQIPSPNLEVPIYSKNIMYRIDYRYSNPKVSLRISMGLQCVKDRYGEYCNNFCRPTSSEICSRAGQLICAKGCYRKPSFCLTNPCKNEGTCILFENDRVKCICKDYFYGDYCENKYKFCNFKPCSNNEKCIVLENNTRICKCLEGFSGKSCRVSKPINKANTLIIVSKPIKSAKTVIILSVLFSILILAGLIGVGVYFLRKEKYRKFLSKRLSYPSKLMGRHRSIKSNNIVSLESNVYSLQNPSENIYNTPIQSTQLIKEDNNYGYLIPIKPSAPLLIECNQRSANINYYDVPKTNKEDPDLLDLPTRKPKKKR